jgi:formiminoglutamate deiminase
VTAYHADYAWLGGPSAAERVLIEVEGERIVTVRSGAEPPVGATRLRGLTLPGFANTHSHAFHRALRGATHRGSGSFWTWRDDMYKVAARLTPDSYYTLARAVYGEMALAGFTCVGEFHYLHHGPGGEPYTNPNAFGEALIAAAGDAGLRITLLDACYLTGGFGEPLQGPQMRFGDGDAATWAQRASALRAAPGARLGAAVHSVRAVPLADLPVVVEWAHERGAPLHFHLSEQPAENEACLAAHQRTPTALLEDVGALGPRSCAVHATHLTEADIALLAGSRTTVCMCPTTERDLADGIGPARSLAEAGAPLAVGSDSHAVIDAFEEVRAVELDERLRSGRRGHWRASELLQAATADGHAVLGWPEAGRLAEGAVADFVCVALDSVRLAGARAETLLESAVFAAGATDVSDVVVAGRPVVAGGDHLLLSDIPAALDSAIEAVRP